ncbi:hypothetical protein PG997_014660 [Apiospora hydei]|uniref:Tyrosinase copper-binding domain-containing protein n=1 Tax=Apiospora hydei TaxID=1337664 RepID=A0ABR1UUG8_9PEZI
MKLSQVVGVAALASLATGAAVLQSRDDDLSTAEQEVKQLVAAIERKAFAELESRDKSFECTTENIVYRQEYGDLSKDQRLDYVKAVQCLMNLPANTPSDYAPGAKSRYDDFVVTHINHTLDAHYTGNFMAWHRWFIYTYETALRDECGYKGYQPYWDWPKYAPAPKTPHLQRRPLQPRRQRGMGPGPAGLGRHFTRRCDGRPLHAPARPGRRLRHDGALRQHDGQPGPHRGARGRVAAEPAERRARVQSAAAEAGCGAGYWGAGWGCLLNVFVYVADTFPPFGTAKSDLLRKPNITEYRFLSEGGFNNGEIGPHGGGHYTINGDPGGDLWVSPAEPAFWVHHGNMDRMWTLWQAIDPENRTVLLDEGPYGHTTWNNEPPSPLTTMDDVINIGWAGPPTTMREMMSTTAGPLCYFYK